MKATEARYVEYRMMIVSTTLRVVLPYQAMVVRGPRFSSSGSGRILWILALESPPSFSFSRSWYSGAMISSFGGSYAGTAEELGES